MPSAKPSITDRPALISEQKSAMDTPQAGAPPSWQAVYGGSRVGAGATPVVMPAGATCFSLRILAGTVTISSTDSDYQGALLASETPYEWKSSAMGIRFLAHTFTGDANAGFVVTWQNF